MGDLNSEYFIIIKPREDDKDHDLLPTLSADDSTVGLPYRYQALPVGSRPLSFVNGSKEFRDKRRQTTMRHPPDVLFEGGNPVVSGTIREKLLVLDVPHLAIQPAVYIDEWGTWHEDYWYLTFTERLDCWSRSESEYDKSHPIRLGPGENLYDVYSIRLDEKLLASRPLEDRRLFQLGGCIDAFVLAHASVASIFLAGGGRGVQVLALADYPDAH